MINLVRKFVFLLRTSGTRSAISKLLLYIKKTEATHFGNLYKNLKQLRPIQTKKIKRIYGPKAVTVNFTAICTFLNEEDNILSFLESLEAQSLHPTEVILVDGGSSDSTLGLVQKYALASKLRIVLLSMPGSSIAEARNKAILESRYETIVSVDAGCLLSEGFFMNLVATSVEYDKAQLVCGVYQPSASAKHAQEFVPDWNHFDVGSFLPSARSVLFRKSIALEVGGFPEFLPKTGEDTFFDIVYRNKSSLWVINTAASVVWNGPKDQAAALALSESYGFGDGLSGVGDHELSIEWFKFLGTRHLPVPLSLWLARVKGYLRGRTERIRNDIARSRYTGVVCILSLVPLTDSGGGQRAAQLALEFARRGNKIYFFTAFGSQEEAKEIFMSILPGQIELIDLQVGASFLADTLASFEAAGIPTRVVVEAPHPEFEKILEAIRETTLKTHITFDLIDNWESQLGGDWFSRETSDAVLTLSDTLIASASSLAGDLRKSSGRSVTVVQNAVNENLSKLEQKGAPQDLPVGFGGIALYVGALWGSWFDWELVSMVAKENPEWGIVLIGEPPADVEKKLPPYLSNVFFLGLKPQSDVPNYIRSSDVCLIPFSIDSITRTVSPLKVYEYLAFGKPVLTMYMPEVEGLPNVHMFLNRKEFAKALDRTWKDSPEAAQHISMNHTWARRVEQIEAMWDNHG
jgi:glycosyltransferase involved in cell wall biosynthesis